MGASNPWTEIWNGQWNGKWNGMEYVQLWLTPITVAVIQGVLAMSIESSYFTTEAV